MYDPVDVRQHLRRPQLQPAGLFRSLARAGFLHFISNFTNAHLSLPFLHTRAPPTARRDTSLDETARTRRTWASSLLAQLSAARLERNPSPCISCSDSSMMKRVDSDVTSPLPFSNFPAHSCLCLSVWEHQALALRSGQKPSQRSECLHYQWYVYTPTPPLTPQHIHKQLL